MRGHATLITGPSLVGCGLLLALALPATGRAAAQVALRPAAGPPGSTVTLVGSGFARARRITITGSGMRAHRVRSSAHGRYTARLVVPTRGGWLRLVSRRGHARVVNRFRVLRGATGGVVELASSRGPRVRFSSTHVLPGATVAVTAQGYRARARLRLSAFGHSRHFRTRRTGRRRVRLAVPAALRPGLWRLQLRGGHVRFRVAVRVLARRSPRAPLAKPVNVSSPQIAGAPQAGKTLTAGVGIWTGTAPIEYSFLWQRCDAGGANCAAIYAATAPTYTVVDKDRGARLRVVVTGSNVLGSTVAVSPPTVVVTATPGVAKSPTLPSTVREGQTVRVTSATFTGSAKRTVTTQWLRCADTCVGIGTNKTSYVPVAADVGFRLQVVQTATSTEGVIQVASNKTDPVQPAAATTGTVAHWAMDDAGPTMVDSARNHHGTLHNVTPLLPGYSGTAFGFNGVNSYVTVPPAGDLSAVDDNVTLTVHMKTGQLPPSTVQDWDVIRSAGGYYDGDEYKMEYAPDGTAHCSFKGNGSTGYKEVVSSAARPLDDGGWHTIQCIKTKTRVETVVDGTVYSAAATIGTITITQGLIVGAHSNAAGNGSSEFYNGTLDEAALTFTPPGG